MLALVTLLLLAFALLTWNVMQQSRHDLAELERLNVQQASMLNRLHVASLEGLNRMDRALERQLRPSLGDPIAALQAVEDELDEMQASRRAFMDATQSTPHPALRDALDAQAERLIDIMQQQLSAIRTGDRSHYRQLTLEAVELSQALTESARRFYAVADRQGVILLHDAERQAKRFGWLLAIGLMLASGVLLLMAWLSQRYVLAPLQAIIGHFRAIAGGDLTGTIPVNGLREVRQLFQELAGMQQSLVLTVSHLHGTSQHVLDSAERLAQSNQALASQTRQQGTALDYTTTHLDELTRNVTHNAESANQASQLANMALDRARRGEAVMERFVGTMEEIHEHASQVNAIVDLIDTIAFQTNLLALNASVEAARAGDQGRGFAVVAGEVRSLASRSTEAAHQIRHLLTASRDSVQRGNALSSDASHGMAAIVDSIAEVQRLMEQIDHASQDQHDGIGKLNRAMDEMTAVTRDNGRLVSLSTQDAHSLREKAERMRAHAGRFVIDSRDSRHLQDSIEAAQVWEPRVLLTQPHSQDAEEAMALLK
ncbi:HAMP domain-containing protein [Billgrantia tianxiuensis]|uniref:HAMP domain-containing protein n=2 Tax=Oceanospirillales TaxID=135619 RepID=A0A6I6SMR1_9GAMM|nr:HAMP domain-containing protein [Halomonas sp. MCCC 1A11057]QHC52078.1 HAMP domain-containing protein [Halomonas tianxiuensis]